MNRRQFLKATAGLGITGAAGLSYTRWVEPGWYDVERVTLRICGLPDHRAGTRLAQISDIHLSQYTGPELLDDAVQAINALSPDAVLLTGDYVGDDVEAAQGLVEPLRALKAPAFAVYGNHDYWTDRQEIKSYLDEADVRILEAYQMSETRKREVEAAVQEAQNRAMAKAALAEAERIEAEQRAALEAPAKAEKARTIVDAEAEAEKRRIGAQAEAAAIYARLEAEARGQYEILAKKGEGLKQIVEACGGAQQAYQMLMLEHLDTLAETAAKAISNIKFDKVVVWEGGNGANNTAGFLQNMARTLPPMMQVMKDIGGVELPGFMPQIVPEVSSNGHGENKLEVPLPDRKIVELPEGLEGRAGTS